MLQYSVQTLCNIYDGAQKVGNSWKLLLSVSCSRVLCLKCDGVPRSDPETHR